MKLKLLIASCLIFILYLCLWPVKLEPVSWEAPENKGYSGVFKENSLLHNIETLPLNGFTGPEDIAFDKHGYIYASVHEGIVRLESDGSNPLLWAKTGGRPLGIDFDSQENLIVADGYLGLLSISKDSKVSLLTDSINDAQLGFADDVVVAKNGLIYFTDASSKFSPRDYDGVLETSEFDVLEHGGHGQLLMFDPKTKQTATLIENLNFANGVTISEDQSFLLINDMGSYRILKYWLTGSKQKEYEVIVQNLPGFPDNITTGLDGKFWVSLAKPRSADLDNLSSYPFFRKVAVRILPFYHPKVPAYSLVFAIDGDGNVIHNLQDPTPNYTDITSARETKEYLYLGSLIEGSVARLSKSHFE